MRKLTVQVGMFLLLATTGLAQDARVELNGFVGYTLSEGFTVDRDTVIGLLVDKVNPTSAFSWGFQAGVFATEDIEIGFLFDQQESTLELKGTSGRKEEVADLDVRNYHGVFTYNFGDEMDTLRPFVMGGLGATQYKFGEVMGFQIDSETKFSSTWAGGVKLYPSRNVGFSAMARWTPTFIKADPVGVWCSPYWPGGCWVVSEADYSNQFEFSGGILLRF